MGIPFSVKSTIRPQQVLVAVHETFSFPNLIFNQSPCRISELWKHFDERAILNPFQWKQHYIK